MLFSEDVLVKSPIKCMCVIVCLRESWPVHGQYMPSQFFNITCRTDAYNTEKLGAPGDETTLCRIICKSKI